MIIWIDGTTYEGAEVEVSGGFAYKQPAEEHLVVRAVTNTEVELSTIEATDCRIAARKCIIEADQTEINGTEFKFNRPVQSA